VTGLMSSVRLWEWAVDRRGAYAHSEVATAAGRASCGVSGARHSAMDALSRSLIATGGVASGYVLPVGLVEGAYGFSYVRLAPVLTADCEKGVIKWRGTSN
jgi:hypothetical protein